MTSKSPLNIVFIGCVKFSHTMLKQLLETNELAINICAIVSKSASPFNSDFQSLLPLAKEYDIPCLDYKKDTKTLINFLSQYEFDVIYCFGWSELLSEKLLHSSPLGVIGYHPTKLPKNRGRHPIIWPLVLGLSETASTFFIMDKGADSGPIVNQQDVSIGLDDDATSLYKKLTNTAKKQITQLTQAIIDYDLHPITQDSSQATYWRQRTPEDGKIDWRMQASDIYNLVRGLTKPYVGAEFIFQKKTYKVWSCKIDDLSYDKSLIPGTVIKRISNDSIWLTVKCGGTSAISFPLENSCNNLQKGTML
ncbi:formyltransferase family protein [Thalassotalea sp. 1_MG-2023]|uniref:formyltransferase family protein n=1 Tax=Thalassotalea sp. 1_MG-2023 TaxID=3062680 RepID=UPI0026E2312C|nr:formyltransferase family protein [Thalassotalea sp. 1_MG-2023]MDO6426452.1 formyltransferase family protein [Thalassotalea sp. 1_MG-2023]